MKKRIFSLVFVIFLLGLYITTFVIACFTTKESGGFFMASLFATVMFPFLLYGYQLILKLLKNRDDSSHKESDK